MCVCVCVCVRVFGRIVQQVNKCFLHASLWTIMCVCVCVCVWAHCSLSATCITDDEYEICVYDPTAHEAGEWLSQGPLNCAPTIELWSLEMCTHNGAVVLFSEYIFISTYTYILGPTHMT